MSQFRVVQVGSLASSSGLNSGLQPDCWLIEPSADGLTALAGGGQTGATQINGMTARVATVATAGDSVQLPPAIAGLEIMLLNDAANPMNVFPFAGDSIDKLSANTAVSQMQQSMVIYTCFTTGSWRTEGLATGFGGSGLQTQSQQDSISAAGNSQGTATVLSSRMITNVTTVGASTGVLLPPSVAGMTVVVNNVGANALSIYPNGSEKINALSASAAFVTGTPPVLTILYCFTAGQWYTK